MCFPASIGRRSSAVMAAPLMALWLLAGAGCQGHEAATQRCAPSSRGSGACRACCKAGGATGHSWVGGRCSCLTMTWLHGVQLAGGIVVPLGGFLFWLRRRRGQILANLRAELAGQVPLVEPTGGSFRGRTRGRRVKGDGLFAVSRSKVIFVPLLGRRVELDLAQVEQISTSRCFLGGVRAGVDHIIFHLKDGDQVGFHVKDPDQVLAALEDRSSLPSL